MAASRNRDLSEPDSAQADADTPVRLRRVAVVQAFPLDDDLVLYDERDGRSYVLNRTGAAIWRLCDGEVALEDLVASIAAEYAEPVERVRPDVEALLTELREAGLVLALG